MNPVRNQNLKTREAPKERHGLAISNGVKILFLVTQSEFGGAQRYIFEVAPFLQSEGYDVLVAAGEGNGELFEKISNLKTQNSKPQIKTQNLRHLKRTPWPWQIILAILEIIKLLKKEKPEVLFLCSTTAGLLGSIASKFIRNSQHSHKNSYHSHYIIYRIGGWAFRDPRPWWQRKALIWLEKLFAPLKDKIIVNSEVDRQIALKYKIASPEKIVRIYNGLDPEKLDFLSREEARRYLNEKLQFKVQNDKIIGCIANFYKTKGLEYLIKAAHILDSKSKIQDLRFMIIGDGPERKNLEFLIEKYRLQDKVFLLGRMPDAYQYLKAFDVFVLPSLKEGFPWVILEAMAVEVPIVATKVGAVPEVIEDGKSGFLTAPGDSENLAKKIQNLLEDSELQSQFVSKAREKLKEFSKEKMVQKTKEVISSD